MAQRIGEMPEGSGNGPRAGDDGTGVGRAGTILSELVEASRAAAEALVYEQKQHAAAQVRGIGEAVRSAAQSLGRSQTPTLARYADQAANEIEQFSDLIGDRSWSEIIAEARYFARRQPWLFLFAATAAGFLAGRVLSAPTNRGAGDREMYSAREASEEVTAAVASGDGKLAGQHANVTAGWEPLMAAPDAAFSSTGTPPPPRSERSVAALLSDLANQIGSLVRQEVALFKAELIEKLGLIGRGVGAIAVGAMIAFSGWLALVSAAILGLAIVLAPWLAALIVGLVLVGVGAGLLYFRKSRLDADALAMRRTLGSLREDEAWVREQI